MEKFTKKSSSRLNERKPLQTGFKACSRNSNLGGKRGGEITPPNYNKFVSRADSEANISGHFVKLMKTAKLLGLRRRERDQLMSAGVQLIDVFETLRKSKGIRYAIKEVKGIYREGLNLTLCYDPVDVAKSWFERDGITKFPIRLNRMIPLLQSKSIVNRRFCLSLLNFTTIISLDPVKDYSTLTAPSRGETGFSSIEKSLNNFLKHNSFAQGAKRTFSQLLNAHKRESGWSQSGMHSTTKAGIKGPTSVTAGYQTEGIDSKLEKNLDKLDSIFRDDQWSYLFREARINYLMYGDPILYRRKKNRDKNSRSKMFVIKDQDKENMKNFQGKISFLSAPAGKTRIVCIGNIWIQEPLLQLHKMLYKMLGTFKTDGTFAQEVQFDRVKAATEKGPVWSFDLTAATDRFTILFQTKILNHYLNGLGDLWQEINRDLTFLCDGKPLKYTVGQPMGLYGSWAAFTNSHHFLVQFAAWRAGYRNFNFDKYSVLGDDVAIWDERVALEYQKLLEILDVDVSQLKSFFPRPGDKGPCAAEFAKRISYKGIEMTPISLVMNSRSWDNPMMMHELLFWLRTRGYHSKTRVPLSRLLRLLNIKDINNRNSFIYQVHVNSIITSDLISNIAECIPKEHKAQWLSLTKLKILKYRVELSFTDGPLKDFNEVKILEERADLDNVWFATTRFKEEVFRVPSMPSGYYIRQMKLNQQRSFLDQWKRLAMMQGLNYSSEKALLKSPGAQQLGVVDLLSAYNNFEFLPMVNYQDLYMNVLERRSRTELRCAYIAKLSRHILKQTQLESAIDKAIKHFLYKNVIPQPNQKQPLTKRKLIILL
jgi:hypothetical protein